MGIPDANFNFTPCLNPGTYSVWILGLKVCSSKLLDISWEASSGSTWFKSSCAPKCCPPISFSQKGTLTQGKVTWGKYLSRWNIATPLRLVWLKKCKHIRFWLKLEPRSPPLNWPEKRVKMHVYRFREKIRVSFLYLMHLFWFSFRACILSLKFQTRFRWMEGSSLYLVKYLFYFLT